MGRFWKQVLACAALAAAVVALCFSPAVAKKPGGGGAPEGTIYFRHDGTIWSMSPDGSNRTQLPNVEYGDPSHARHAGTRWFVTTPLVAWEHFPDVQNLSAVWASSETGASVPLVVQEDLAILTAARWTPNDNSVSFIAERWELDGNGQPTVAVEAGLYTLEVAYAANGAMLGSVPGSLQLVKDLWVQLRMDASGFHTRVVDGGPAQVAGTVAGHSWAPDQTAFTFGIHIDWADGFPEGTRISEIWIVDLLANPQSAFTLLDSRIGTAGPEWSPDGQRIGYGSWEGTVIYTVSTGRRKTLRDNPNYGWGLTHWSPSGTHFVTHRWDKAAAVADGIYRFTADLTDQTLLTAGLCPPEERCSVDELGWRN